MKKSLLICLILIFISCSQENSKKEEEVNKSGQSKNIQNESTHENFHYKSILDENDIEITDSYFVSSLFSLELKYLNNYNYEMWREVLDGVQNEKSLTEENKVILQNEIQKVDKLIKEKELSIKNLEVDLENIEKKVDEFKENKKEILLIYLNKYLSEINEDYLKKIVIKKIKKVMNDVYIPTKEFYNLENVADVSSSFGKISFGMNEVTVNDNIFPNYLAKKKVILKEKPYESVLIYYYEPPYKEEYSFLDNKLYAKSAITSKINSELEDYLTYNYFDRPKNINYSKGTTYYKFDEYYIFLNFKRDLIKMKLLDK